MGGPWDAESSLDPTASALVGARLASVARAQQPPGRTDSMRQESSPPDIQPNITAIMSDVHDPGVTGCYGDRIVDTPNIDRLAREGVAFDACCTTSPLCVPARLSFTAGKYVSRCGDYLPVPDSQD